MTHRPWRLARQLAALFALSWALLHAPAAQAGRACEAQATSSASVQKALGLAERLMHHLDRTGAQVVVLARMGENLHKYGLRYSHLGFAYRDGRTWRVVHKLNHCGTDHAALYRQGLGDFFMDNPFDYEAGVVVLAPEVQTRLLPVLKNDQALRALHTPTYNMLAYPWSQRFQQSNQWAIETMALAMDPAANQRDRAQAWLKLKGYEPTELHLSTFTRLGARLTQANISFDDHPGHLRFTSRIRTVTVDSVFSWLATAQLGGAVQVVR